MKSTLKLALTLAACFSLMACEDVAKTQDTPTMEETDSDNSINSLSASNGYYLSDTSFNGLGARPVRHNEEERLLVAGFSTRSNSDNLLRYTPILDYLTHYRYAENGALTSLEITDEGVRTYFKTYEYDAAGKLTTTRSTKNAVVVSESFSYDSEQKLVSRTLVDESDGSSQKYNVEYDLNGNRSVMIKTTPGVAIPPQYTYFYYDTNSRLIETQNDSTGNGSIDGSVRYAYDDAGNVLEKTVYNASGELTSRESYDYTKYGSPVFNEKLFNLLYYP